MIQKRTLGAFQMVDFFDNWHMDRLLGLSFLLLLGKNHQILHFKSDKWQIPSKFRPHALCILPGGQRILAGGSENL